MLKRTLVLRVDGTREYRDVDVPEEVEEPEDVQTEEYQASGEDAEAPTELEQLRADVDYLLMMTEG